METTITTVGSVYKTNRCIVVEGPPWGDAEFYGKWLLAAAEANAFRDEAFKERRLQKEASVGPLHPGLWSKCILDANAA